MSDYHVPVLLNETVNGLNVRSGDRYIDATVGGGGHVSEIIKRGGIALGIDADKEAIAEAQKNLGKSKGWKLVQGNFRDIARIARENGFDNAMGIVFDLGVSSHQLDTPARGFSHRFDDATLDLRFNQEEDYPVREFLNSAPEHQLYEIFVRFGEEELAGPIAHALQRSRRLKPIETVRDLKETIHQVVQGDMQRQLAVTRILQALRIWVNDELGSLQSGLSGAEEVLAKGGRLAVLSFHSLEDRIVKKFMRNEGWMSLTKTPIIAQAAERAVNRRSKSAKLRIAQKII